MTWLILGIAFGACAANISVDVPTGAKMVLLPEDLGPAEIDISNYPPGYQKTYREIFIPVFGFLREKARIINSPLIEMDAQREEAERNVNPDLFLDSVVARITKDGWKKEVERVRLRPPCCGACPVLNKKDAAALWKFLVYDSLARKTGPSASHWIAHRKNLVERFEREYPDKWKKLYAGHPNN